jgi:hypothetical protein
MNDIRHNTIQENTTIQATTTTTLSPNSSSSSTASTSISAKLMNNSMNIFSTLIQNQQQQQQHQQAQTNNNNNNIYESYIKAATLLQQQQQQQHQQQQSINKQVNNSYDAYRSLLQYNPVAAAAAACAAYYNTKDQPPKIIKNDNSYETVSPSLSDEEDEEEEIEEEEVEEEEDEITIDDNEKKQQQYATNIKIEETEKLEEGEISRNNNIDLLKKRSSSISSLSSQSSIISSKLKNTKETFDKMQKCLINDTDNAIIQCFNQGENGRDNKNGGEEEDDEEFIKQQKENIPSLANSNNECKKLSNNYKIDSLLDSSLTRTPPASTTATTTNQSIESQNGLINKLKNEIIIAVNNAIQKTFENFIRLNYKNSNDSSTNSTHHHHHQQHNDNKRILKRNLISSNINKPFKRQRLNDNPSSRSLYKNQKYLSSTQKQFPSLNGYEQQTTAFKLLSQQQQQQIATGPTPNTNRFSINHLTTNPTLSQPQVNLNKPTNPSVNQLYAAALSHLSQQSTNGHNNQSQVHHPHPQQQLFFAAAAAASNPYLNTNRLFAPYLLDSQNLAQQQQQQLKQHTQSQHIFHTPIKRRRTKVTDTRLSPRTSSLNLSQLSKSTSNLLTQTASPSMMHDQDTSEYDIGDDQICGESNGEQQQQHDDDIVEDDDDDDKQQSLHSTNDGLLNVYSATNDNDDQQQSSDYTGYQISFLKKKKQLFFI